MSLEPIAGPVSLPAMRGPLPKKLTLGAPIFALLLAAFFGRSLVRLFVYAYGESLHSHIVLVPLIAGYLIHLNRIRLGAARAQWNLAIPLAVLGALTFAALQAFGGTLSENDHLAASAFAFLCFLWAGGFVCLGREWMRANAFPVAFLLFLIPLPDAAAELLETASKYASADAAAMLMSAAGLPMLRDGLFFKLPGLVLEVAQECSGIRSSWVLFITSLLASHLFLRSNWRRAILVAFIVPLGIIRNGFRIAVIAWLCIEYGPHMISSIIHRRGGPFFFVLSLAPLFALLWWLRRSELKKRRPAAPAVS